MATFQAPRAAKAPLLVVGRRVRVWLDCTTREESSLSLISYVDEAEGTCDVIIEQGGEERCGVKLESVMVLEDFEETADAAEVTDPKTLKDRGNVIFQRTKDFYSARKLYLEALAHVTPALSVGVSVLISSHNHNNLSLRPGLVTDLTPDTDGNGQVDVMYDERDDDAVDALEGEDGEAGDEDQDDEETVSRARVASALNADTDKLELQRSCCINLARCCLKLKLYGWGVRYATISAAISRTQKQEVKPVCDAIYIRATMLLSAHKPVAAKRDARYLQQLRDVRATDLLSKIDAFNRARAQGNKSMAKEVAKWVEQAMSLGGSKS